MLRRLLNDSAAKLATRQSQMLAGDVAFVVTGAVVAFVVAVGVIPFAVDAWVDDSPKTTPK